METEHHIHIDASLKRLSHHDKNEHDRHKQFDGNGLQIHVKQTDHNANEYFANSELSNQTVHVNNSPNGNIDGLTHRSHQIEEKSNLLTDEDRDKCDDQEHKKDDVERNNDGKNDTEIKIEHIKEKRLHYRVNERPPLRLLLLFAIQQGLLPVSGALSVTLLVTDLVCGRDDPEFKAKILSGTFLMIGLSTFCMSTFGLRLPIFQGPSMTYIIPLIAFSATKEWRCPSQEDLAKYYENDSHVLNLTDSEILPVPREIIYDKVTYLTGSLMVTGVIHCLIGLTGLMGFMLRYIGPITIVPAIMLIGLNVYTVAVKFSETCWSVAISVAIVGIILSLYLTKYSTPIPAWNKRKGLHIVWFPLHQVFAVLIAIIFGWIISGILTYFDLLSSERTSVEYYARTDTQLDALHNAPWFNVPYPCQFGFPRFDVGVFLSFMMATVFSVLDSVGDYNACSRMCYVPLPPAWAVNRGLAVEGVMSFLSGSIGNGHATVSYGGNIGAIGLTKVASRSVFQLVGVIYIVMAVISKIGTVFVTVPHSVLGGCQILTFGIFIGIVLSNLQYVDLAVTRNVAIIGISLLMGLSIPYWVNKPTTNFQLGSPDTTRIIKMLLSNGIFIGGFLACFLDNTIPGTAKERGIMLEEQQQMMNQGNAEEKSSKDGDGEDATNDYEEGIEVYDIPWLPDFIQRSKLANFIRIFPGPSKKSLLKDDKESGAKLVKD